MNDLDTIEARAKTTRFLLKNLVGDGGLHPESPIALLLDALNSDISPLVARVRELEWENARLRDDTARVDYLEAYKLLDGAYDVNQSQWEVLYSTGYGRTLREALDDAINYDELGLRRARAEASP